MGCQTDGQTVNYVWAILDLIESEKSSGVTITFIPVAWATIGFSLTDTDGGREREREGGQVRSQDRKRAALPAVGKPLYLISSAIKTSSLIWNAKLNFWRQVQRWLMTDRTLFRQLGGKIALKCSPDAFKKCTPPIFAWSFAHRCDDFSTGRSNLDSLTLSCG